MSLQGKKETLYSTSEAAKLLGLREPTVRQYVFRGLLFPQKIGQTLVFTGSEIERYNRDKRGRGQKKQKK
jgi:DNA-binding transcriptional MerR regulator